MHARSLLLLLLLVVTAPSVAASWLPPHPFRDIAWVDGDTLLTNSDRDVGRYELATGRFQPLADASVSVAPRVLFATSPDGRWAVYAYGHPPIRDRPMTSGDVVPGITVAFDLASGARSEVFPSGATALAGGPRHLFLAHAKEGLVLVSWGDWSAPRRLEVRDAAFDVREVRALALDAGETTLALWQSNGTLPDRLFVLDLRDASAPPRVLVSNVSNLELLAPEDREGVCCKNSPAARIALAPDSQRIALAYAQNLGPRSTAVVRVLDAGTLEVAAERRFPGAVEAVTWGPRGLVVASTVNEGGKEPRHASTLRVLRPDLAPVAEARVDGIVDAVAWSPDGERMAVGGEGRLRIYDAALHEERQFGWGPSLPVPGPAPAAVAAAAVLVAVVARGRLRP